MSGTKQARIANRKSPAEGIASVVCFKTEDGVVHESMDAALLHDANKKFLDWCDENLDADLFEGPRELGRRVLEEWTVKHKV